MTEKDKSLIKQFFELTTELRNEKIINSSRYLGDIAEYICKKKIFARIMQKQKRKGV